jgi:hypothetical protein
MKFTLKNIQENSTSLARKIGYTPLGISPNNDFEMVRELGGSGHYPRFHVFLKEINSSDSGSYGGKEFVLTLHLDQKKPSYGANHAHSGEYDGDVVEEEARRIKTILTE